MTDTATPRQAAYRKMILTWAGQADHASKTAFANTWANMGEPERMALAVKLAAHPGFLKKITESENDAELKAPFDVPSLIHYLANPAPSRERSQALAWLVDLISRAVAKSTPTPSKSTPTPASAPAPASAPSSAPGR